MLQNFWTSVGNEHIEVFIKAICKADQENQRGLQGKPFSVKYTRQNNEAKISFLAVYRTDWPGENPIFILTYQGHTLYIKNGITSPASYFTQWSTRYP